MTTLEGAAVVVTGATGGIGAATARAFAEEGARVACLNRSSSDPDPLVVERGGWSVQLDLEDAERIGEVACKLLGAFGRGPDALVNAAGAFELAAISETSAQVLDRQLAVNLRGPFLLTRALLPAMLERGAGRIIHVGSIAGRVGFPENGAYAASKFGLRGMHEVLLAETRGSGVEPTLIEPGAVDTRLWDPLDPDSDPNLPDRANMLSTRDVADAIVFVATRPPRVRIPYLPLHPA